MPTLRRPLVPPRPTLCPPAADAARHAAPPSRPPSLRFWNRRSCRTSDPLLLQDTAFITFRVAAAAQAAAERAGHREAVDRNHGALVHGQSLEAVQQSVSPPPSPLASLQDTEEMLHTWRGLAASQSAAGQH